MFGRLADATQHRADAGEQLAQIVGLDHVVVGADLEPDDAIDRSARRGRKDDAQLRGPAAQPARERQPIFARHSDVEDRELDVLALGENTCRLGVAGGKSREAAVAQILGNSVTKVFFVFHDEDGCVHNVR
jgi:hypothetical protein